MGSFVLIRWLTLVFLLGAATIVPLWKIVSKAGYPGALCLLLFIPGVNWAALWIFAFSRWPSSRN